MKILLINLPKDGEVVETTTPDYLLDDFMSVPPLGLMSIASEVDKTRHNLKLIDISSLNSDISDTVKAIEAFNPDLLGISVVTRRLYSMYEIARRVKALFPEMVIIVGGPHINASPVETMELGVVDYALAGYGDKTFALFVECLDKGASTELLDTIPELYYMSGGKIKKNPPDDRPLLLDDLPFPDRSLLDLNLYFTVADSKKMTTIYTSRGCPYRCVYCDVFEKKFYYRSPKKIVDEFEYIKSLGIEEIHIFDDTFNLNRQRVMDMCNEILARGLKIKWNARVRIYPFDREMLRLMKSAGCERLHVGVESLDPATLKYMRKKITLAQIKEFFAICNEVKISTLAYFIIGFPQETPQYRKTLYQEIMKLKPTYVYINILYPLAKTEFNDHLIESGALKKDYWADYIKMPTIDFSIPLWRSPELQDEIITLADDIHRKFYLSPKFILQDIRRGMTLRLFFLKARAAVMMFIKTKFRKHYKPGDKETASRV